MFSPFRLLTFGVLAVVLYMGFYAVPAGAGPSDFDPVAVGAQEAATWRAGRDRDEWAAFTNATQYYRALHRLTWFRSAQLGFTWSRVVVQAPHMTGRYERLLPDLEEIIRSEKTWKGLEFDTAAVARQQLSWLSAGRGQRGSTDDAEFSVSQMSEEMARRFGLRPDQTYAAASSRAQAITMLLAREEPDWDAVSKLLVSSYTNLKLSLDRASAPSF